MNEKIKKNKTLQNVTKNIIEQNKKQIKSNPNQIKSNAGVKGNDAVREVSGLWVEWSTAHL